MASSTPEKAETAKTADATKSQGATQKQPASQSAQEPAEGPRSGADKSQTDKSHSDKSQADNGADNREAKAKSSSGASQGHRAQSETKKNGQSSSTGPAGAMLMADHRAVEKLFDQYEHADERRKRDIIERTAQALIVHTLLEEEIFYPACREDSGQEDELDEAQVEHDSVKILIADLVHGSPDDHFRDAKFRVLAEQVRHHVREEEQDGGILREAQSSGIDTPELARRMSERRDELESGGPLAPTRPISLGRPAQQGSRRDETRRSGRNAEERGEPRFMKEKEMASYQQYRDRDRDDRGRFVGHDDDDYRSSRRGNERPRDDDGRFVSRGSSRDDDDREGGGRSRMGEQRYRRDDDDDDRQNGRRGHGGWFGDSEGHSEASRRGWDNPDHGRSGWYGDSEGHSQASRRGWENPDHGRSGWYGDPEGHSEASRRGWEDRGGSRGRDYDDDRDHRSSRSSRDDDRGYSSRSSRDDRDDDHRGRHGGWSGDPRGHSEASRRGWENRR